MNPYMKRTNSISTLPPTVVDTGTNQSIHQYSLLSSEIDITLNDENEHNDVDDEDTMSLSCYHQHAPNSNETSATAKTTTTTATNITMGALRQPTMTKFTTTMSFTTKNHNDNMDDTTATKQVLNFDNVLTQFEVWVQRQQQQQQKQEKLELQTYLHEIIVISKKHMVSNSNFETTSDGGTATTMDTTSTGHGSTTTTTKTSAVWTVPRVIRFMTNMILPLLQLYIHDLRSVVPVVRSNSTHKPQSRQSIIDDNDHNDDDDDDVTPTDTTIIRTTLTESSICFIYMTLEQLMEHTQIWNTYLIYIATTTTSITNDSNASNTIINDHHHIGSNNDNNRMTLFSALKKTFQYIVIMHRSDTKSTKSDSFKEFSQSVFVLCSNIWFTYQFIQDHCSIQNTSSTIVGNSATSMYDQGTTESWWHDLCLNDDDDDTSILLQIVWCDIISEYPIKAKFQRINDNRTFLGNNSKKYIMACCSFFLIQLSKESSRNKDCIPMLLLANENERLLSMMEYVRNFIQNHHLHTHHHTQSTWNIQPNYTDIDIHIVLRYIEVLVHIYAKRNIDGTNRKRLDEIRQLIFVDHIFVRYLIESMIRLDNTTTTRSDEKKKSIEPSFICDENKMQQLRQQELSLSIVKILYDVVPDTIEAILSSQLPAPKSVSTATVLGSLKTSSTNQQIRQDPNDLIHSFLYQTLYLLATNTLIDQHVLNHNLDCLLFFHLVQRTIVRQCMISYFDHEDGSSRISNLLQQLLHYIEVFHSLPAASFLEQLLTDVTDTLRYDGLSRRIWSAVHDKSSTSTEQHQQQSSAFKHKIWKVMSSILMHHECSGKISSRIDSHVPYPLILIKLVDMAYIVVRNIENTKSVQNQASDNGPKVKSAITPDLIKSLLQVVMPNIQLASLELNELLDLNEENTPTVQNLSRCDITMYHDGTSIIRNEVPACVPEVDTTRINPPWSSPWQQCVQLSVATLLTELTNTSHYWENGVLVSHDMMAIRERILDIVNAYVVQLDTASMLIHTMPDSDTIATSCVRFMAMSHTSPDITRRRLRLLTVMSQQTDNEENLSNILHISELKHRDNVQNIQKRLELCILQVKAYQEQEEQLLSENKSLLEQLSSKDIKHQYEKNELHRKITQRAKQLVVVHSMERQQLEHHMHRLSQSVIKSQNELHICQQSEQKLQSTIQETVTQIKLLRSSEQEYMTRVKHLEHESQQISDELAHTKVLLQNATSKNQMLEEECHSQAERIEDLKESEMEVQNCLENLFGDMVKLARVYVTKENEVDNVKETYKTKLEELHRRLQAEQELNRQFDKQDRQTQYDLEILQRKYQRVKEKLEQERQDHQRKIEEEKQRSKRNGPISYMNQLHQGASSANASGSTTSDLSSAARKGAFNNTVSKENVTSTHPRRDRSFR